MPITHTLSGANERFFSTTGFTGTNWTVMCWLRVSTLNVYSAHWAVNDTSPSGGGTTDVDPYAELYTDNAGNRLEYYNNSSGSVNLSLTTGTWYHVAMVNDAGGAGNVVCYRRTATGAYGTANLATAEAVSAPDYFEIGNDGYDTGSNGNQIAFVLLFDRVLTQAEIDVQSRFAYPVLPGCTRAWPLWDEATANLDYRNGSTAFTAEALEAADIADYTGGIPVGVSMGQPHYGFVPTASEGGGGPAVAVFGHHYFHNVFGH